MSWQKTGSGLGQMQDASAAVVAATAAASGCAALARLVSRAVVGPGHVLMESIDSDVFGRGSSRSGSSGSDNTNDGVRAKLPATSEDEPDTEVEAEHAEMWQLVQAARGGDGEAFGQLYDRYVDAVFRFIYYRVNDRALAEDFTSETFLRALRRISGVSYQGRDIGAWFMTIARNIVFDHMKSARFRLETTTAEIRDGSDSADGPELAVLTKLTNTRLLQAVDMLNDEQKECIVLRFLNGLSVAETAEVMGKNDGAIKALQHRAVKRLAAIIGDELR